MKSPIFPAELIARIREAHTETAAYLPTHNPEFNLCSLAIHQASLPPSRGSALPLPLPAELLPPPLA